MIFLGAGASKPFGIPTLQEFSQDVFERLEVLGHSERIDVIKSALEEFGMKVDFESLYAILEAISDPIQAVRRAGPFTAFLMKGTTRLPKRYNYRNTLEYLRRLIYQKCSLDQNMVKKIVEVYDPLFEMSKQVPSEERFGLENPVKTNMGHIIATTNYDMSLELYFTFKEISFQDGYRPSRNQLEKYFEPSYLDNPFKEDYFILKLHA